MAKNDDYVPRANPPEISDEVRAAWARNAESAAEQAQIKDFLVDTGRWGKVEVERMSAEELSEAINTYAENSIMGSDSAVTPEFTLEAIERVQAVADAQQARDFLVGTGRWGAGEVGEMSPEQLRDAFKNYAENALMGANSAVNSEYTWAAKQAELQYQNRTGAGTGTGNGTRRGSSTEDSPSTGAAENGAGEDDFLVPGSQQRDDTERGDSGGDTTSGGGSDDDSGGGSDGDESSGPPAGSDAYEVPTASNTSGGGSENTGSVTVYRADDGTWYDSAGNPLPAEEAEAYEDAYDDGSMEGNRAPEQDPPEEGPDDDGDDDGDDDADDDADGSGGDGGSDESAGGGVGYTPLPDGDNVHRDRPTTLDPSKLHHDDGVTDPADPTFDDGFGTGAPQPVDLKARLLGGDRPQDMDGGGGGRPGELPITRNDGVTDPGPDDDSGGGTGPYADPLAGGDPPLEQHADDGSGSGGDEDDGGGDPDGDGSVVLSTITRSRLGQAIADGDIDFIDGNELPPHMAIDPD